MQDSQKLRAVQVNVKRIVNNTIVSLIGQLITWTSTLLLTISYGRFLGDSKFGELYLATNFVGLVGFPLEASFNTQLTRDVAQQPDKAQRYLTNTLLLKALLWIVVYSLIFLLCQILNYSVEERTLILLCGITLLCSSTVSTFAALHYACERTIYPVVSTILEKGLSALIGILLLRQGADVEVMALVLLGGSMISLIWQAFWFFRLAGVHFLFDMSLIRKLLRTSIPFVIYGGLSVVYYRIDTFLLSLMASTAVIGWYGAGYRLFDTMVFLPSIVIGTIMSPVFSKLSTTSEKTLRLAIEKTTNFLLLSGMPMATGLIVAAPNIVAFLYHQPEFSHTIPVLQGLAPGLICLYINSVATCILTSTHQEKKIPILAAVALVFNLGLNLILIPRYQQVGAAVVTSLTELLLLCVSLVLVPRRLLPLRSLKVGAKAIIASAVMAFAVIFLSKFSIFMLIPVAAFVYLVCVIVLRAIPREDVLALYNAFIRKKTRQAAPMSIEDQSTIKLEAQVLQTQIIDWNEDFFPLDGMYHVMERYAFLNEVDTEVTLKRPVVDERITEKSPIADEEVTQKRPVVKKRTDTTQILHLNRKTQIM